MTAGAAGRRRLCGLAATHRGHGGRATWGGGHTHAVSLRAFECAGPLITCAAKHAPPCAASAGGPCTCLPAHLRTHACKLCVCAPPPPPLCLVQVIKETSALTFMIAGTVKEVVTGGRAGDGLLGGAGCWACNVHVPSSWRALPPCRQAHAHAPQIHRMPTALLLGAYACAAGHCTSKCRFAHRSAGAPRALPALHVCRAVLAAVAIMGDKLTAVNSVGLCIVIVGVLLFNRYKYHRMKQVGRTHRIAWHPGVRCKHLARTRTTRAALGSL